MMAVKLLVKIAVMMMAPGGTPVPPEAREREPPSFFFLDLLPRWEKGFPSGPWPPWHGRGESPSEIGSVFLSVFVSALWILPFHRFFYNRRSVTPIGLKPSPRFFSENSLSCGQRRAVTALRGAHEGQGRPPCLVAPSGTVSR